MYKLWFQSIGTSTPPYQSVAGKQSFLAIDKYIPTHLKNIFLNHFERGQGANNSKFDEVHTVKRETKSFWSATPPPQKKNNKNIWD